MCSRLAAAATLAIALAAIAGRADAEPRTYPPATAILLDPLASPYRVHLERMSEVALVPGGALTGEGGHRLERTVEVPVVEEGPDHVRLLIDHDDARMMVWLEARALAWSLDRPVRLAGRGDAGVWLGTGAPVDVISTKGRRSKIIFFGRGAEVSGTVDADAVVQVFPVSVGLKPTYGPPAREIRVAPGGALLHRAPLDVDVLRRRGRWTEVEHRSRYLRIRGWVANDRVDISRYAAFGTGGGSGFGMSHTDRVDVPAGACLFDRTGGQVVGLVLATQRRYVAARDGDWWQLYVGTPWGTVLAWAHALPGGDAGPPVWDRCAPADPAPLPADED